MRRSSRLALLAVFAIGSTGCGQPVDPAFCEQAEFFASRSVRDLDHHAREYESASTYLDALKNLRDLAPESLQADLEVLVNDEQVYDPSGEDQSTSAEVTRAGQRVGAAIEQRCDLQLPHVRG